jgi:uroporphyrinogen decarboxylase
MMEMTPRERVLTTLNHEEPDRVPIVIGVSNATGIKMGAFRKYKDYSSIRAEDRYLYDWPELGTAAPDEESLQRLQSDVRGVLDAHPADIMARNKNRKPGSPFIDSWGIGQVEIEPGVWFPGIHPLKDASSIDDLEQYEGWPDPQDQTRLAQVRARAERLSAEGQYAIMATPWLLFPLERAFGLQGMDEFLLKLGLDPDFAKSFLHKTAQVCKALIGPFLEELGDHVDLIKIGDDLGTQSSLLMSPKMYREILKPIHADYIAFIKARTNAKLFFHTDGDVYPLIEDFIEIGVDVLNPIQTSAGRMANLHELKQQYGAKIIFCGAVDTQRILPLGTPAEVREEVRRVIQALGPGGGYMLASVHTIMDDVPPENIQAMVEATQEFGRYPLE